MPKSSIVLTIFLILTAGTSSFAGDNPNANQTLQATHPFLKKNLRFNSYQNGYVFGNVDIPISSSTADGKINTGYGIGFEGTVFIMPQLAFMTYVSTAIHSVDIGQSRLEGNALTYWLMPGVLYNYQIVSNYAR